jgi:D-alanyl-D-alanine carboxypeptidase
MNAILARPQLAHAIVGAQVYDLDAKRPLYAHNARTLMEAASTTWGSRNLLDDNGLVTKGLAGYVTTRRGHHLAFAFYINRMAGKSRVDTSKDAAHYAGETLGEMAADAYLLL